jgi:glucosylceramidase
MLPKIYFALFLTLIFRESYAADKCKIAKAVPPTKRAISTVEELSRTQEIITYAEIKGLKVRPYHSAPSRFSSSSNLPSADIRIDTTKTYQKIYGFGASITESCLQNIKRLSPVARKNFFSRVFSREQGAGFSYLRIPIGANDFSVGDYTLNDSLDGLPDPQLKLFNTEKLQAFIDFIKESKTYNPDIKILISPWTPPAWMKDTQKLRGGQLKKENFEAYAQYLSRTIGAFETEGVQVDQLTILNEPLIGDAQTKWFFPQAYMTVPDQMEFIQKYLTPKLKDRPTKILLHDHNWDNANDVLEKWEANKHNPKIEGMAYHCYGGDFTTLQKNLSQTPGVPSFNTECTSTFKGSGLDKDTYFWWLQSQSLDAVKLGVSGSLGWNLCLNEKGGPVNDGCKDCRGLVTIDSKTAQVKINPEVQALEATSRVTDPGSLRIESSESDPDSKSVAFKNPDGTLSMVLVNRSKQKRSFKVHIDDCFYKEYELTAGATLSVRWPL